MHRLVKRYGWQEEFSISLLMKVFELSLKRNRKVILVGAQINKPFLEMLVKAFQKEYGEPIQLRYEKIELDQSIAKSVVYRIRSPKYPDAWFPTTTSITKNRTQRETIKQRIETILLSLIDDPLELSNLKVGIVKPKKADIGDFLTPLIENRTKIFFLDFGNLRGSNKLEHCDVLIVIGTYKVNIEELQKDFAKFYHKNPSIESRKLHDGGYSYDDPNLENFRRMCEDYEMYQAIHRLRPALREKKIFVFGLIPKEIQDEFETRQITFEREQTEKNEKGVLRLVEWKSFEQFVKERIGKEGIFQYELVKAIWDEFGGQKEHTRVKIKRFIEGNKDEFEIVSRRVMGRNHPFIKRR